MRGTIEEKFGISDLKRNSEHLARPAWIQERGMQVGPRIAHVRQQAEAGFRRQCNTWDLTIH